jgi:hypothetical protein
MRPVSSSTKSSGRAGSCSGGGSSKVVSSSSTRGLSCTAGSWRTWNGSRDGPSRAALQPVGVAAGVVLAVGGALHCLGERRSACSRAASSSTVGSARGKASSRS